VTNNSEIIFSYAKKYYIQHNKFPPLDYLEKSTGLGPDDVQLALKILEKEKKINRKVSKRTIPSDSNIISSENMEPDTESHEEEPKKSSNKVEVAEVIVMPENTVSIHTDLESKIRNLKKIILILGVSAICLSFYFNSVWFMPIMGILLALPMSFFIVGTLTASFECTVIFWRRSQHGLSLTFGSIFVVVLIFSMAAIVAGQYNNQIKAEDTKKVSYGNDYKTYQDYDSQVLKINAEISNRQKTRDRYTNLILEFDTNEKQVSNRRIIDNYEYKIRSIDKEISGFNAEIKGIQEKKDELSGKGKVVNISNYDFYEMASRSLLFHPNKDLIRFFLLMFPALLLDVVSSLFIAIYIFLDEKEGK
jgi:hypothetical protein